ncbi:MAG: YfiR family protein [Bacteroidota bacterium]
MMIFSSFSNIKFDDVNTNAKVKVMFIYNFTKYIEWPAEYKKGDFVIGMLGTSSLYPELQKMKLNKKRGNQSFEIIKYSSVDAIEKCHILFIAKESSDLLNSSANILNGKCTLIVTEKPGLIDKGTAINFVITNNKQGFELNRDIVKDHGLSLSASLVAFAVKVI